MFAIINIKFDKYTGKFDEMKKFYQQYKPDFEKIIDYGVLYFESNSVV